MAARKPLVVSAGSLQQLQSGDTLDATVSGLVTSIVEGTGTITTTSTTDVLATGMTLTPGAGTYIVWWTGSVTNSNNNGSDFMSVYANGVQAASSERTYNRANTSTTNSFACMARVTVAAGQTIEGRWRVSTGTGTMLQRSLVLLRVA